LAKEHGVGKTSLKGRIKGAKSKAQDTEAQQRLTVLEELALKDWCQQLEAWGFPARIESLRRMATDMLLAKGDAEPLGHNWQSYFFQRHPELKSKFVPLLDKERATAQNPAVFQRYFNLFWTLIILYKVDIRDIYNMDEKCFMQGVIAKQKVVVSRDEHFKGKSYATQCGNREWTSLIECVSLDGCLLSPWVIFKGVQCKREWMKRLIEYNSRGHITMSHNGWTDNAIGLEWFKK
jgi:hypothetical protein